MLKPRQLIKKIKNALQPQSGFGLVETLVAISILGLSAVAFISSLSAGAISVKTLDEQTIAQQLLTSQMEALRSQNYDVSGNTYSLVAAPDGYSLTLSVNSHIYSDTDLQKITATVWHHGIKVETLENYKGLR